MIKLGHDDQPQVYGFFLHPRFSMLAFTSAVEPLRAANRLSGRKLYEWKIISHDGRPVSSSSLIEVLPHGGLDDFEMLPNVVVVAGLSAQFFEDRKLFAWLRRLARRGCRIGALSTGSYTLAKAGLLDGYRCTIHWENLTGFREDFSNLDATGELFEIDRSRFTCSGGTAALDLMLSLMALEHGRTLATQVAEQFIHERIRDTHDRQRMSLRSRLGISHPKLSWS
jgi:transcriptional regulator GlxA family with amidase domain